MATQRIPPPAWFAIALALIVGLHRYFPIASLIPAPWHYSGIAIASVGVFVAVWAVVLFRHAGTTIIPLQESSALITTGPYRFTRNPMYLSMALLLLGAAVFAGSLSPLIVIPAFVVIIQVLFIAREEAMLAQRFPAEFAAYSTKVRRWF
jgi:protein-S-isoprenylcysteine O-methyltransferase Ste14